MATTPDTKTYDPIIGAESISPKLVAIYLPPKISATVTAVNDTQDPKIKPTDKRQGYNNVGEPKENRNCAKHISRQ